MGGTAGDRACAREQYRGGFWRRRRPEGISAAWGQRGLRIQVRLEVAATSSFSATRRRAERALGLAAISPASALIALRVSRKREARGAQVQMGRWGGQVQVCAS